MSKRSGFSLIEVIIVVAVAAGILFVISSLRVNVSGLENVINQKLFSRKDVDQAFQIMVTDIRSASPSSLGAYPLESASTSSLIFFNDFDSDGVFERIRYSLVTSTIEKGIIEPSDNPLVYSSSSETVTTIIEDVIPSTSTDVFRYFDSDYTGIEDPLPASSTSISSIRVVKVEILVDTNPGETPQPTLFTHTVTIRNLRGI